MNKKLKNQIKVYAGVAGAILSAGKLNAQVVYVDVNPDTLIDANPCDPVINYNIDIDQDGLDDFIFKAFFDCLSSNGSAYIKIQPLLQNKVNNAYYHEGWWSDSDTALNVMKMNPGDTINGNGVWLSSEKYLWSHAWGSIGSDDWYQGAWGGIWGNSFPKEGCLPFLLYKNSQNYYGWMHIEVTAHSTFILKDYVFQTQPNVPILACDTANLATGISEYNNLQFNLSQQNNSIHISTLQKLNHTNISVYDLLGKEILQQPFEGNETTITLDKKGIYFVEVKSEKGIFRKKVFIH